MRCRICQSASLAPWRGPDTRGFWHCDSCGYVQVAEVYFLDASTEKARYACHENADAAHLDFLRPALQLAPPRGRILDFGCGPNPPFAKLLPNYSVSNYDPYFFPTWPQGKFDTIYATECWEHFYDPSRTIAELFSLLANNGQLLAMTEPCPDEETFATWGYARDPSHVGFFSAKTMRYLAHLHARNVAFEGRMAHFFQG